MARRETDRVHSISTLPPSQAEDRDERTRSYLVSMAVRTVCFLMSGVFVAVIPWTPGVWICIAGAVLLPYPAVVFANRQDKRSHVVESSPLTPRMVTASPEEHDWAATAVPVNTTGAGGTPGR